MRIVRAMFVVCLAAAGLVVAAPADARPLDQGHFHDAFTDPFDCDGTPVQRPTRSM